MKLIMTTLTFLLIASIYVLMIQEVQAQTIEIYSITFESQDGRKIDSFRYVAGADLSKIELPEAPELEGYVFIGWSAPLPDTMPNHSVVYVAVYMQSTLTIVHSLS